MVFIRRTRSEAWRLTQSPDRKDQLFAFLFPAGMRYLSVQRGSPVSQPNNQLPPKLRSSGVRASDVHKFLDVFRALDRTVVEISMQIYKVPRRDRAAMLQQHRRLHATIRERLIS